MVSILRLLKKVIILMILFTICNFCIYLNNKCLLINTKTLTPTSTTISKTKNEEKQEKQSPSPQAPPWWIEPHVNCHDYITKVKKSSPSQIIKLVDTQGEKEINFTVADVFLGENETCSSYLHRRHFIQQSQSKEEANFPIAYNLIVHKHYPQVEMLIRTIYRPEHCICIHIDVKADKKFKKAMQNLVKCFPQDSLFIAPNPVDVVWGEISVVDAELVCMRHLWNLIKKKKWKYFINLGGQEFPLRTNLELVRILKIFNGANNLEGTIKKMNVNRIPHEKMSFNVTWTKGAIHMISSAGFVNFILNSNESRSMLYILRKTGLPVPDETYFSTLNHNPQFKAPGGYLLEPETHPTNYPFIARLKNWYSGPKPDFPCLSDKFIRTVCIWGLLDLPFVTSRPELFVNKFHWNSNSLAIKCMQEWYWNRTKKEVETGKVDINLSYYENLSFVKHHQ